MNQEYISVEYKPSWREDVCIRRWAKTSRTLWRGWSPSRCCNDYNVFSSYHQHEEGQPSDAKPGAPSSCCWTPFCWPSCCAGGTTSLADVFQHRASQAQRKEADPVMAKDLAKLIHHAVRFPPHRQDWIISTSAQAWHCCCTAFCWPRPCRPPCWTCFCWPSCWAGDN